MVNFELETYLTDFLDAGFMDEIAILREFRGG